MHATADTAAFMLHERLGAARDAGRYMLQTKHVAGYKFFLNFLA
jgi:hypothetical protein